MEENKTGVWVQTKGRHRKRLDSDDEIRLSIGDYIQVFSDVDNVLFKVVSVEYNRSRGSNFQKLLPVCSVFGEDDKAIDPTATGLHRLIYTKINSNNKMLFDGDLYRYINCVVRTSDELQVVLIRGTMNEDLEIKTGTISADEIKIGTLAPPPLSERRGSFLPYYQQKPITATSEAAKNFKKEYYGTFGAERELKSQIPTIELDQTLKKIAGRMDNIMISDLRTNHIEFKEKEMYTKNLKEMIKKPIYVDKEITVKEPMLDNNGKQIEKDGKPVFKVKHYHGMVKILWVSGAETVAYVEGNDVYDRENGFKTCVLKYLCGNAGAHDAVDFWTNKYVKYPSSCVEVTENLCKLEEIIENDKHREEERKGLPHAKFLRRTVDRLVPSFSDDKLHYAPEDEKLANEFKKLAKKYFPELKCREIYINDRKQEDVFVAIK
jgi:hypothetical protein|nr:MAG TPA: hypothetical protein [Caudoviricetes sp.]